MEAIKNACTACALAANNKTNNKEKEKETKLCILHRKWASETARTHASLTSNLEPRSRGLQTRDTSRSHLTCPHCSSLGQPAAVKTRGQKPAEQEQK